MEQYKALFAAGWKYEPSDYDLKHGWDKKPALGGEEDDVPYGWRDEMVGEFSSMQEAVENWEKATGENFFEEGCNCCGAPFSMDGGDEHISGDTVKRKVIKPWEV